MPPTASLAKNGNFPVGHHFRHENRIHSRPFWKGRNGVSWMGERNWTVVFGWGQCSQVPSPPVIGSGQDGWQCLKGHPGRENQLLLTGEGQWRWVGAASCCLRDCRALGFGVMRVLWMCFVEGFKLVLEGQGGGGGVSEFTAWGI